MFGLLRLKEPSRFRNHGPGSPFCHRSRYLIGRPRAYKWEPGCPGWVPSRHGAVYANEYRFDARFEALVAEIVAKFIRRFGAKPDKKIVDRSSGKSEFMEDTVHGNSDGMVVGVDRFWVVRAAGWAEWLSGGEKGFDGFVSENEQRGHRPQTGW